MPAAQVQHPLPTAMSSEDETSPHRSGDYFTLFYELFQRSSDLVYLAGLQNGVILDVNDAFLQLLGFDREQVVGRTPDDLAFWVRHDELHALVDVLRTNGRVDDSRARVETATRGELV